MAEHEEPRVHARSAAAGRGGRRRPAGADFLWGGGIEQWTRCASTGQRVGLIKQGCFALRACINFDAIPAMKPVLDVRFFRTDAGSEPVRNWLKDLSAIDRKTVGEDIKTVHFGWPLGMPLVDHLGGEIWEVRVKLGNRIARGGCRGSNHGAPAWLYQEATENAGAGP